MGSLDELAGYDVLLLATGFQRKVRVRVRVKVRFRVKRLG